MDLCRDGEITNTTFDPRPRISWSIAAQCAAEIFILHRVVHVLVPITAFCARHVVNVYVEETVLVDDRDTRIVFGVVVVRGGAVAGPVTVIESIFIPV